LTSRIFDIAIIGGGVNGTGIARDAAGRGLSVYLAEKSDLASATSSASTKLIHGGLRYLEQYDFKLVRDALKEREVLLAMAPHIISPLRFVLPHNKGLRPAWMIRIGLFLYDHLGGREYLPGSYAVDLKADDAGHSLNDTFIKGFEYSDCRVDDSRLVVLSAQDAKEKGADIRTRTEVISATKLTDYWEIETDNLITGEKQTIWANILVNASGPWVNEIISKAIGRDNSYAIRLVKGSHIVVPKIFDHDRAYIFQNQDRRIIFAIPYQDEYTLIGTTDLDFQGDPAAVKITDQEIDYLCSAASEYFINPVSNDQVVWSYSGVRPLFDDGVSAAQETTRDYQLEVLGRTNEPALMNVYGGKLTSYRHLAEVALTKLSPWLPRNTGKWTKSSHLPGGDFPMDGFQAFFSSLQIAYPSLPEKMLRRLALQFGTRIHKVLGERKTTDDLGQCFGGNLYQFEVEYLIEHEWAITAEDILWRRTKTGLSFTDNQIAALSDWLKTCNA